MTNKNNLVVIFQAGLPTIIGQKFGREIKRPFTFKVSPPVEGRVSYQYGDIPFVSGSMFVEGSFMFYFMENKEVQESYYKLIAPKIPVQGG
jgi:hypothetical protein